jgi:hypothetical protein
MVRSKHKIQTIITSYEKVVLTISNPVVARDPARKRVTHIYFSPQNVRKNPIAIRIIANGL